MIIDSGIEFDTVKSSDIVTICYCDTFAIPQKCRSIREALYPVALAVALVIVEGRGGRLLGRPNRVAASELVPLLGNGVRARPRPRQCCGGYVDDDLAASSRLGRG